LLQNKYVTVVSTRQAPEAWDNASMQTMEMGSYSEESQVFIIKNGLFLCCQSTRVHTHTHTQDYSKEVYRPHVGENVGPLFRVRVRENPVSYLLHTS